MLGNELQVESIVSVERSEAEVFYFGYLLSNGFSEVAARL